MDSATIARALRRMEETLNTVILDEPSAAIARKTASRPVIVVRIAARRKATAGKIAARRSATGVRIAGRSAARKVKNEPNGTSGKSIPGD
jgi:hypothetical protein